MRFAECDADRLQFAAGAAELVCASGFRKLIVDVFGQKFGRRVDAFEFAQVIEIAIVQRGEGGLQHFVRAADIDYDSVRIETLGKEGCVDNECCPVQSLRWPEHRSTERMGNHDVVTDFYGKQRNPPSRKK